MKDKIKAYIGLVLIILAIVIIWYWENYGREKFLYMEVLTFNTNIEKNTIITDEIIKKHLISIKIEHDKTIDKPIRDINLIKGKETKQYIPAKAQLSINYFDDPILVLEDDKYIFSIPNEWIKGFPNSLRRKDKIYFYKIKNDVNLNELNENENENNLDNNDEYVDFNNNNISIPIFSDDNFVLETYVAYVKDNANREVTNLEVTNLDNSDRLYGSSNINEIEIIATKDDIKKLENTVKNGYQFLIAYRK